MIVGITGSRDGLTDPQRATLHQVLADFRQHVGVHVLHHGDCVGVDAEVAAMARDLGYWLAAHPPTNPRLRAYVESDTTRAPQPYLERDEAIVDACDVLIACPDGPERPRSGTWFTVRYARRTGRDVVLVDPAGVIVREQVAS